MRVLVLDDEPLTAASHAWHVERSPDVETAATAVSGRCPVQAVQAAGKTGRPVDLVLLDVDPPDMSGLDVARALRARREAVDLLLITAHRDVATVREATTPGVVGHVIKPFTYTVFEEKLAAYRRCRSLPVRAGQMDQAEVDRAFAVLGGTARPAAPKGLPAQTPAAVTEMVREGGWPSAGEIAERSSLSRVTARRRLEDLVERGLADRRSRCGTRGRPELEHGRAAPGADRGG